MKREFEKLEAEDGRNAALRSEMNRRQTYHELEMLLQERTGGEVTLEKAVEYYLANFGAPEVPGSAQPGE